MTDLLESESERRTFRGRRLRFSVMTSLFSKAATLSINFLALPLLFRCLGPREFALYATLNAASAWLAYANLGIGPKLVTSTAAAFAERDRQRIQQLISSVTYPIVAIVTAVAFSLAGYLLFGRPESVLGSDFVGHKNLVHVSGMVLIATAWFQVCASVYEAVQTGYHEQGIQNLFLGMGNLVSLFALISLVCLKPTITGAICCLTIPVALSRGANIVFLRNKYREIRPRLSQLKWSVSSEMLSSGLGYSMTSVGSFLNHQLPILLINHILSPALTSTGATMLNIVTLAAGLVTMITIPMCASIADSVVNNDFCWIRTFLQKLIGGTASYAVIVGIVLCTVGGKVLLFAFGRQLIIETSTLALVSGYLILVLLEHVLVMTLIALGRIWQTAGLYLLRGAVTVALVLPATKLMGVNGVFIVLLISVMFITMPAYSFLLRYTFRALRSRSNSNSDPELCGLSPVAAS